MTRHVHGGTPRTVPSVAALGGYNHVSDGICAHNVPEDVAPGDLNSSADAWCMFWCMLISSARPDNAVYH